MDNIKINREHKDRLFRLLFGDEKNKSSLLSLYNAINNTHSLSEIMKDVLDKMAKEYETRKFKNASK